MKLEEAIDLLDEIQPNAYSERVKVRWINSLEGRIAADIMLMAPAEFERLKYSWPKDRDTELLVKSPHDDIYLAWLQAQTDLANKEYERYQNSMLVYNAMWGDYLRWFAALYDPGGKSPNNVGWTPGSGVPIYYITAYGLAVQQGFKGGLDAWLRSLVGKSAYEIDVEHGYTGTEEEWLGKFDSEAAENWAAQAKLAAGAAADSATAAAAAKDRAEEIAAALDPDTLVINTKNLAEGAVTRTKLAPGAVNGEKLENGAVTEEKLASAAVGETQLKNGAVTAEKLGSGSVGSTALAGEAVTEEKLASGAVTKEYKLKLRAGGWAAVTEGVSQSVAISGLKADSRCIADLDCGAMGLELLRDTLEEWAKVLRMDTAEGMLTAKAETAPTADIPLRLLEVRK